MMRRNALVMWGALALGGTVLGTSGALSSPPPAAPLDGEVLTGTFLQGLVASVQALYDLDLQARLEELELKAPEIDENLEVLGLGLARVRYGNNHGAKVVSAPGTSTEVKLQLSQGKLPTVTKVRDETNLRMEFTGTLGLRRTALPANGPCTCNLYLQLYQGQQATGCRSTTQLSWDDQKNNAYIDIKTPVNLFTECASVPAGTYEMRVTLEAKTAAASECTCFIGEGFEQA